MKTLMVISTLFTLLFNSFIYECNGQKKEVPRPDSTDITDTIFFEADPKYNDVFIPFEEMPEFPGGEKALTKYISENTKYPISAIRDSISGLVRLIFVIDTDGSTKNYRVYRSLYNDIDNECIRVVKEMPKWKPGSNVYRAKKGLYRKVIPVYYTITFNFVLNESGNKNGIIIRPK